MSEQTEEQEKYTNIIQSLGESLHAAFDRIPNNEDRAAAKAKLEEAIGIAMVPLREAPP
jgi:hypothetical protein